jgi:hypothetical protein
MLIDLEMGAMHAYLNGEYVGQTFTEALNGLRPHLGFSDAKKLGPVWSEGFYPCVTVPTTEAVFINLGQVRSGDMHICS